MPVVAIARSRLKPASSEAVSEVPKKKQERILSQSGAFRGFPPAKK
jgi:hypothetical protein